MRFYLKILSLPHKNHSDSEVYSLLVKDTVFLDCSNLSDELLIASDYTVLYRRREFPS